MTEHERGSSPNKRPRPDMLRRSAEARDGHALAEVIWEQHKERRHLRLSSRRDVSINLRSQILIGRTPGRQARGRGTYR